MKKKVLNHYHTGHSHGIVDASGKAYVADTLNNRIQVFAPAEAP
jgi:hypothetical protein